jgi:hypothetical protein
MARRSKGSSRKIGTLRQQGMFVREDPEVQRRRSRLWCSVFIDLILVAIIFGMTVSNRQEALACDTPVFLWLIVFGGIAVMRVVKNIIQAVIMNSSPNPLA